MRTWLLSAVAALGIGLGATADQASAAPAPVKAPRAAAVCRHRATHTRHYRAKKGKVKNGMHQRVHYRHHRRHAGHQVHHRQHGYRNVG